MEVRVLLGYIDEFVDTLTDGDLDTVKHNRRRWTSPEKTVGALVQGIMFPNLDLVDSTWVQTSLEHFSDREDTWDTLYFLFKTFHGDSFQLVGTHANYPAFVSAIEKLREAQDAVSVRKDFKTVLKEALKCLLPAPNAAFRTHVHNKAGSV